MNSIWRKLQRERGSIFLEAALVMPLFFILLCFFADVPRIMGTRQRLVGASRLVAEVRARSENGELPNDFRAERIGELFFANIDLQDSRIMDNQESDSALAAISGQNIGDGSTGTALGFVTSLIGNIVTGGAMRPYWTNIMDEAGYHSGDYRVTINTVFPAGYYQAFANVDELSGGLLTIRAVGVCHMPNTNPCRDNQTGFAGIVNRIRSLIPSWVW